MTIVITDKNSLLYWYPKIKDLPIPQPRTEIYVIPEATLAKLMEENMENLDLVEVNKVAGRIGFPLFCRTDQASNKHFWDRASYIGKIDDMKSHIFEVISHNLCADILGLPFKALVFREYIPMASEYTAFYGSMPVSPERRYFIENGKVLCHHPYWVEEAIVNPSTPNWRDLSRRMNTETPEEIELLTKHAELVSSMFEGFWSVDFCKAKDGRWILIDMALGEDSWHQIGCSHNRTMEYEL